MPATRPAKHLVIFLYLPHAVPGKVVNVVARGVERSETTRATTGDGPNGATIQERADSPGATISFLRSKAPGLDMCPGETAATDAQWGDRAFERQYRDRMGLRWLVCVCVCFACTINRRPAWRRSEGSASCTKNEDGSSVLTGHRRSMSCRSAMAKG